MPELQTVKVARGDFDNKYVRIETGGARNRPLNSKKLKSIAANWADASKDTITLVRDGEEYLIADGQHRIAAASSYFRDPVTLNAMVWDRDEVPDLADFITAFNRGTPFTTSNLLQVYRDRSRWPIIAAENEMPIVYARYRGAKFSWTSVMRGVALADLWRDRNRFGSRAFTKEELTREIWLEYPEEGIHEIMDALKWWAPIAEIAYRSLHRTGILYGDTALATAISVYRKYHARKDTLQHAKERLIASNQLATIRTLDPKQVRWFSRNILLGMNYRVSKEFVELYGETGKD